MTTESIDFGELSEDDNFKQRILGFRSDVEKAASMINSILERFKYEELRTEDKIRFNLFMAFAINTFYWMYLRLNGVDPNQHEIKDQINRVKEYMKKSKEIYEKNTLMPRVNQDAAKRFVRSALWTSQENESNSGPSELSIPCKRKRSDSTE